MSIQIRTIDAKLNLNITYPKIDIRQSKGHLNIKQTNAELIINKEEPKVIIDQYQCFAESGLKNNADLTKQFKQLALRKVLEGIRRKTSEGRRMINIKRGNPNAISDIAKRNFETRTRQFNYDIMPKSRPKIDFEGSFSIDWKSGGVDIDYRVEKPINNFHWGKVEMYLNPYPDIEISYIDDRK